VNANRLNAALRLEPAGLTLEGLQVNALEGVFRGRARLAGYRRLSVEGDLSGIPIASLGRVHAEAARIPWNGSVSGSVKLAADVTPERIANTRLDAELGVAPADGSRPIEGTVALSYDQAAGQVRFCC